MAAGRFSLRVASENRPQKSDFRLRGDPPLALPARGLPPGDSDASRDSAVALSVGKAPTATTPLQSVSSVSSVQLVSGDLPLFSQSVQSVQFSWFRGTYPSCRLSVKGT